MNYHEYLRRIKIKNYSHYFSDYLNYNELPDIEKELIKRFQGLQARGRKINIKKKYKVKCCLKLFYYKRNAEKHEENHLKELWDLYKR